MVSPSACLELISFLKWNLEASFSAMLHFAVLALTHSSKVLKGIDLLFVSTMVLKETLVVQLLSMVLKELALLTSCFVSWKETFFPPDLHMVLKGVSLTLLALSFSLMTLMPSTLMVLKEVNLCPLCSLLPHVSFGWGFERSLSACAPSHGLERTGWMVLKGLRCNSGSSVVFCYRFLGNGLERNLWSWCLSCFLWLKLTWKHFYIIHEWDLTSYLLGVQWLSPLSSWSLEHRSNGLEMTDLSSAGVSVWYCHNLPVSHHHNIQGLSWIFSGIHLLGSLVCSVHEETWSWKNLKVEC